MRNIQYLSRNIWIYSLLRKSFWVLCCPPNFLKAIFQPVSSSIRHYSCFTQAVCCSDHVHCCPQGTKCDLQEKKCIGKPAANLGVISMDMIQIQDKGQEKPHPEFLLALPTENVKCPDGQSECRTGQTCCKTAAGNYGCCPLPKVRLKFSHEHLNLYLDVMLIFFLGEYKA